ncbi:MAG: T9SS type A sorting domain-containing protein [Bacteroidales bacterium]|nr:T9SS type A sorting domain-containing protein [Bacteroidales bacterium]
MVVELPYEGNVKLSVYDLYGRSCYLESENDNSKIRLDVSSLLPGMYIIRATIAGRGYFYAKFMVVK